MATRFLSDEKLNWNSLTSCGRFSFRVFNLRTKGRMISFWREFVTIRSVENPSFDDYRERPVYVLEGQYV